MQLLFFHCLVFWLLAHIQSKNPYDVSDSNEHPTRLRRYVSNIAGSEAGLGQWPVGSTRGLGAREKGGPVSPSEP